MSYYVLINRTGKDCGTKALTDSMADRLEKGGWTLIPAGQVAQAQTRVVKH